MPSTSRGYPYPSGSDDVDIPGDIQALAAALNTDVGAIAATTPSAPVLQTLADAAGDLAVGSAADTFGRLALGTDNYALTVNTGGAGVAKIGWEDPTANPLTAAALASKVNTATVGNLLSTAVASCTSGLSLSNTTVSYASPSATVTAGITGNVSAYVPVAAGPAVVPGLPYTMSARVTAVTGVRPWAVTMTFYTAGLVAIGTAYYGNWLVSAGTSQVTVVAPATAAFAQVSAIYGHSTGGAIGDTATITEVGFWQGVGGTSALPGSVITGTKNVPASAELSAVNMLATTHTDTVQPWIGTSATLTATAADKYGASTASIVLTATSATAAQAASAAPTSSLIAHPAVPGETYTFTGFAKLASGARYGYCQIQWYNNGTYLSSTAPQNVHLSTAAWARVTTTGVAPATANAIRLVIFAPGIVAMGSAIGDVIYYSGLMLNRGIGGDSASPGAPVLGTMPVEAAYKMQVGNMLSPQEATGTDTNGTADGFIPNACTLASSSAQYDRGARSLLLTATAATAASIYPGLTGYNNHPATPGVPYTAYFRVRNGTFTGQWLARLYFYTASGTTATGSPFSGAVSTTVSSSGWTTVRHTVVAPADAAYVMPYLISNTAFAIGETAYVDSIGVWQGAGGEWAYPGTPIPNLGQYTDESVGRRTFVWDEANQRFQMVYGDTGWRDVTASLDADWEANPTAPAVLLRRVNNAVQGIFRVRRVTASGARGSYDTVYTLPTGFTDGYYQIRGAAYNSSTSKMGFVGSGLASAGLEVVFPDGGTYAAGELVSFSVASTTTTAWPTTLPGTAVGSIPA